MSENHAKRPLRIGLTGGIASGKSTVADMFADLGVPVIDTDVIAREVVEPGQPALQEIADRFGNDLIDAQGHLDRRELRRIVFADEAARKDLEAILHPRIGNETRRQAAAAPGPYQLIVVPLLVGSPLIEFVDRVLLVDCSEETQVRRLLARDAESEAQARQIIAAQSSRSERMAIANDVITNDAGKDRTLAQVVTLHKKYIEMAHQRPA